ncbi:MAG: nucleotidyltransferase domain-containing protein [Bacteroidetes bacterium]|nr:MAG: nucleotidyltransferase domain-containing protein [Bacteroidota bacterium]
MKKKIPKSTETIKPILLKFKKELKELYGDNMLQIILFGSYARGDIHSESDIDLLLILNKMKSPYHENVFMNELLADFNLEFEKYFSVITTTLPKFNNMKNPLYENVKNEGFVL